MCKPASPVSHETALRAAGARRAPLRAGMQAGPRLVGENANRLRRCPRRDASRGPACRGMCKPASPVSYETALRAAGARRAPLQARSQAGARVGAGCKPESDLPEKREMDALPEAGCPIPVRMIGNLAFLARRGALRAPAARSADPWDTGEAGLHNSRTTRTGIMRGYLGRSGFAGCCGRLRGDNPKRRPVGAQARCPCRRCRGPRSPFRQLRRLWGRTQCRRRLR